MGTRFDAALAALVLVAVGIAFVLAEASVSPVAAIIGGLGTIGFELVAARDVDTVRDYWERPVVQGTSLTLALLGVAIGSIVAPSSVLSFALGTLVTYLVFLAVLWGEQL